MKMEPTWDLYRSFRAVLDTGSLSGAARALGLTPEHGVRVRLTGPVPLSDEEFATLTDRAGLMVGAMILGVLLTKFDAKKSSYGYGYGYGYAYDYAYGQKPQIKSGN